MNHRIFLGLLLAGAISSVTAEPAMAQFSGSNARSLRNATRNYLYNRPTVSPYINLTSRDSSIGLPNYYTLVRPQIERQQEEVVRQRQQVQMQEQLNTVQDQFRQSQQQQQQFLMTGQFGWSSRGLPRFGTTLNYFPGFRQIAVRR